jgi:hypothetical protein
MPILGWYENFQQHPVPEPLGWHEFKKNIQYQYELVCAKFHTRPILDYTPFFFVKLKLERCMLLVYKEVYI